MPTTDSDVSLKVSNVTKRFGDFTAVDDLSFDVRAGRVFGFLGPNGAGKSTLLKMLTGELRAEAKPETFCRVFGEELWSLEEIRHRIGVVMPESMARTCANF
jgi:ABC-type multidrug transport system ATPase subunit